MKPSRSVSREASDRSGFQKMENVMTAEDHRDLDADSTILGPHHIKFKTISNLKNYVFNFR